MSQQTIPTREQIAEAIAPWDWKRRDDDTAPSFRVAANANLRAADRVLDLFGHGNGNAVQW